MSGGQTHRGQGEAEEGRTEAARTTWARAEAAREPRDRVGLERLERAEEARECKGDPVVLNGRRDRVAAIDLGAGGAALALDRRRVVARAPRRVLAPLPASESPPRAWAQRRPSLRAHASVPGLRTRMVVQLS